MNKAALAEAIADRTGLSKKQAESFLEQFVDVIEETLSRREDVTIAGFGTFMAKYRSARMGVNPQNPTERIEIPAVIIPKFKAGKGLKDTLKAVPADELPPAETSAPLSEPEMANTQTPFMNEGL